MITPLTYMGMASMYYLLALRDLAKATLDMNFTTTADKTDDSATAKPDVLTAP
ncbi:hypothetical protein [Fibrella forsythiae]|uniref:Uncharacterized protein n=1 Tax=Fibrella forsythiae TaxID=2817061 RepID=A0ABS3JT02_9BACT|nr:hypothetical protein [Fibrella forsythiae]MBO0952588.1 hypothetical protein [Fibrella forsythiae]